MLLSNSLVDACCNSLLQLEPDTGQMLIESTPRARAKFRVRCDKTAPSLARLAGNRKTGTALVLSPEVA